VSETARTAGKMSSYTTGCNNHHHLNYILEAWISGHQLHYGIFLETKTPKGKKFF